MKNKGFTLIELLAVIVILAIIALIAVPIILNIVNDSKEESNKRSVELYAKAIENAVATYQLKENKAPSTYSDIEKYVEYEGDVVCKTIEIYEEGSIYLGGCKVNGSNKEYTYGKKVAQAYKIGDIVTFAGSRWYVIEDSAKEQDYVTLLKEKVLTNDELGDDYSYYEKYDCNEYDVEYGDYGCATVGEKELTKDVMAFYWSDECHSSGIYGNDEYEEMADTMCKEHIDYDGSKVKEFLEGTYINKLGENNLKEVDGYKIRLITVEELLSKFDYRQQCGEVIGCYYENYYETPLPAWVYSGFGEDELTKSYWTMSKFKGYYNEVQGIGVVYAFQKEFYDPDGSKYGRPGTISDEVVVSGNAVRPVINLKKSAI